MLRKTILALAACATLGSRSALTHRRVRLIGGVAWHGGWHHGYVYRPAFHVYAGPVYGGCMVRRWVYTPVGPVLRWVNRCY